MEQSMSLKLAERPVGAPAQPVAPAEADLTIGGSGPSWSELLKARRREAAALLRSLQDLRSQEMSNRAWLPRSMVAELEGASTPIDRAIERARRLVSVLDSTCGEVDAEFDRSVHASLAAFEASQRRADASGAAPRRAA